MLPTSRLLAKIISLPSGETNACWSVYPVQSSCPAGTTVNSSLVVHGGQPDAVACWVLWYTMVPFAPGNAAPATPGRRMTASVETATATATRRETELSEGFMGRVLRGHH